MRRMKRRGGIIGNMPVLIQMVVVSLLLYLLIKKIPALVQGLLSGSPSLSGASMTQTAKNVTSTAVATGAAVASGGTTVAANMAKAASAANAQAGGGMAGIVAGGLGAAGKGASMMVRAAGRGVENYTTVGKAVTAGKDAAKRIFGEKPQ